MTTNLLPCPFCGGTALTIRHPGSHGYVNCNTCDAAGPGAVSPSDSDDAGRWNMRSMGLSALDLPPTLPSPCWGRHQRLGHRIAYGKLWHYADGLGYLISPAVEGDESRAGLTERRELVPMAGPAFYGFEVLEESEVLEELKQQRPRLLSTEPVRVSPLDDGGIPF